MDDRTLYIPGTRMLAVPAEDVQKLLALGDGTAALLYLHVLSTGTLRRGEAARALKLTEKQLADTLRDLRGAGLLKEASELLPPADGLPEYDAADIISRSRTDTVWTALLAEAQRVLGHLLSTPDMKKLFGIYDHLGLPPEVIMLLINHCAAMSRRRYGETRLPGMSTIEKEAYRWAREEILTLEQAEAYLAEQERREEETEKLRRILQLGSRKPSPTERNYMEKWLGMGFSLPVLEVAYDRTVVSTGKLTWAYMDKILQSWQEKGLFTPEDVERLDSRRGGRPARNDTPPAPAPGRRDDDLAALENMLKNL